MSMTPIISNDCCHRRFDSGGISAINQSINQSIGTVEKSKKFQFSKFTAIVDRLTVSTHTNIDVLSRKCLHERMK